jgi:hypothetical protein
VALAGRENRAWNATPQYPLEKQAKAAPCTAAKMRHTTPSRLTKNFLKKKNVLLAHLFKSTYFCLKFCSKHFKTVLDFL